MILGKILVVDDESEIRSLLKEILSEEGYEVAVATNAEHARKLRIDYSPELILLDIWMPDVDGITLLKEWVNDSHSTCSIVMISGHGTIETAVDATRLGAFDYVEKPLSLAKLLRTVQRALEFNRKQLDANKLRNISSKPIGHSPLIKKLRLQLTDFATRVAPVVLVGESNTGRESFARFLHDNSARAAGPFVSVVASILREIDLEVLLLGQGSTLGLLEKSCDGTLFLNELGDLPPAAQRILFGVLSTGEFARLGETQKRPFTARVLSSAVPGVMLQEESIGKIKEQLCVRYDLLTLLNTLIVIVPPLRAHPEDISALLSEYVDFLVENQRVPFRRFSVAAQNRLRHYPWPGNLQELRSLVHRLLLQIGQEEISLDEVDQELVWQIPSRATFLDRDLLSLPLREAREHFERAYLKQQLLLCHGKVTQLAKRVKMERTHLYRKLRTLDISFRVSEEDKL